MLVRFGRLLTDELGLDRDQRDELDRKAHAGSSRLAAGGRRVNGHREVTPIEDSSSTPLSRNSGCGGLPRTSAVTSGSERPNRP
jgi:hypothetical protein